MVIWGSSHSRSKFCDDFRSYQIDTIHRVTSLIYLMTDYMWVPPSYTYRHSVAYKMRRTPDFEIKQKSRCYYPNPPPFHVPPRLIHILWDSSPPWVVGPGSVPQNHPRCAVDRLMNELAFPRQSFICVSDCPYNELAAAPAGDKTLCAKQVATRGLRGLHSRLTSGSLRLSLCRRDPID